MFHSHRVVTVFIYLVCVYFKYGNRRTAHLLFPYREKIEVKTVKLTLTFRFKDECCLCRVESYIFQENFADLIKNSDAPEYKCLPGNHKIINMEKPNK